MESVAFFIFTVAICYVFYWSVQRDDIQDRIDEIKNSKKINTDHPGKGSRRS